MSVQLSGGRLLEVGIRVGYGPPDGLVVLWYKDGVVEWEASHRERCWERLLLVVSPVCITFQLLTTSRYV